MFLNYLVLGIIMDTKISFKGEATIDKVYLDRERMRYYAEISMQGGVEEFPDASTRLKIPLTPEQYDFYKSRISDSKPIRILGKLELISRDFIL